MKIPGLELPRAFQRHPEPWRMDDEALCLRDGAEAEIFPYEVGLWPTLMTAPELASALVEVTQDLADCLEDFAPSRGSTWTDPVQHPAVQTALAALAKARGEK